MPAITGLTGNFWFWQSRINPRFLATEPMLLRIVAIHFSHCRNGAGGFCLWSLASAGYALAEPDQYGIPTGTDSGTGEQDFQLAHYADLARRYTGCLGSGLAGVLARLLGCRPNPGAR